MKAVANNGPDEKPCETASIKSGQGENKIFLLEKFRL